MKSKLTYFLPLLGFAALLAFLLFGLSLNPRELPSALIGKPVPTAALPRLDDAQQQLSAQQMRGKVWLLNVWASWCTACRQEQPVLLELSRQNLLPMLGLNYKDQRREGARWLQQFGNPFQVSLFDEDGKLGMELGVVGVPETFLIDARGIIRFKHNGILTPEILQQQLLPLINKLQHE